MVLTLTVAVLVVSMCSQAVTILSGPSFTKATNAPLAGVLQLTTDEDTQGQRLGERWDGRLGTRLL